MSFEYKAGLHHVGSYQISGIPFVSGGITAPSGNLEPLVISFPSVTQKITVHNHNTSTDLKVGFSRNGIKNSNFMLVDSNKSNNTSNPLEMRVRCTKIYLLSADPTTAVANVSIAAELTGISDVDLSTVYSGSIGIG